MRLLVAVIVFFNMLSAMPQAQAVPDAIRGQKEFDKHTCSFCHMACGNLVNPAKPLRGPIFDSKYKTDKDIVNVVRKGVTGTAMQPFSRDKLSDRDLADIIAYIRTFSANAKKKK